MTELSFIPTPSQVMSARVVVSAYTRLGRDIPEKILAQANWPQEHPGQKLRPERG